MRAKVYDFKEFQKILSRNGFELSRTRGSHFMYKKEGRTLVVNKGLNKLVARRLIREYQLAE